MNAAAEQKLAELDRNITWTARKIALNNPAEIDAEDIEQEIKLKLIEMEEKQPGFLNDSKQAYVLQCATWGGQKAARRQRYYRMFNEAIDPEREPYDDDDNQGGQRKAVKSITYNRTDDFELADIRDALKAVMGKLDETNRQIVTMLYKGFSQAEIAKHFGITPAAVSQHKKIIAQQLAFEM